MKEMRFYIDTPSININQQSENNYFQMSFDLREEDFVGILDFKIDPESVEWANWDEETEVPRSFNRLILSLSTELEISPAKFVENAYFLTIKYLDAFFRFIQIELSQYWVDIGPIRHWSLLTFLNKTNAKWVINGIEEKGTGMPIGGYSKKKKILFTPKRRRYFDWSDELDTKQILRTKAWIEKNMLVNLEKSVDLEKLLLSDSKRLLLNGDYKSSSVLAVTVLERPLESFIKVRCKAKGISKNTLDAYDKNHFVGDYLKLLLPLVLEPNELTEWLTVWIEETKQWNTIEKISGNQIIEWAIELNKARNKAVHEGITPEFDTLDKGIFAIEAIYEFVKEGSKK